MLPNLCGFCQQTINSLKESIECIGPCEKSYHLNCAKIDDSERDFFIIDGHCRYKCHNCTRRDSDEVFVTPVPKAKRMRQARSRSADLEHLLELVTAIKDNSDCALGLIKKLTFDLQHLSNEIKVLKKEHSELKTFLESYNVPAASKKWIDMGGGEPSFSSSDCLHNTSSAFDLDVTEQKILKIEASVSTILLKSERNNSPPEVNSDKELLKKMTVSRSFPWKVGSFLLLLAVAGLLCYDIQKHGTFHLSSTGHFLNDIGALQYAEHAWARTIFYSNKSYHWAEKNVPLYYKIMEDNVKPYLELLWDVGLVMARQMQDILAYVEEKTPLVIEWVNHYAPGLLEKVKQLSIDVWEIVKENALLLWQFFLHYSYLVLEWVKTNIFVGSLSPENLQKYSEEALNTTQVYVIWTYDWVCQKVQTLSKIQ